MYRNSKSRLLAVGTLLIGLALAALVACSVVASPPTVQPPAATASQGASSPARPQAPGASGSATSVANPSGLAVIRESQLPAEGRRTLALIRQGGPFPYNRDGVTFGNFERLLPRKSGGYYKEYTVPTPGESDRGARRIVAGKDGEKYYTPDHYESFKFIAEGK
ncbi:ribonuclease domain-containing protein [Arthrobacter sp. ZGTC131]|uniref:ribonuclease domain-containing protein n=1 Tax=Arthrobacter sp. ZGTC131 TaxID=2058898 RepID=UPI000CE536EF|nr:ribonuclease domain-containing protein [Arthrobacter sp. ZGTC131]